MKRVGTHRKTTHYCTICLQLSCRCTFFCRPVSLCIPYMCVTLLGWFKLFIEFSYTDFSTIWVYIIHVIIWTWNYWQETFDCCQKITEGKWKDLVDEVMQYLYVLSCSISSHNKSVSLQNVILPKFLFHPSNHEQIPFSWTFVPTVSYIITKEHAMGKFLNPCLWFAI